MIITKGDLINRLSYYGNANNKIGRLVKEGKLFKIKNGLYNTDSNTPGYYLASAIYGPSYLSFDYALYYYGLIPERVTNYTSATFGKKKKKKFVNQFGTFFYRDVPQSVYAIGVITIVEGEYSYQIATPEKAICDKLYILSPLRNLEELKFMLLEDLRIDNEELKKLDCELIKKISEYYHSTNVSLFSKFMRRDINE